MTKNRTKRAVSVATHIPQVFFNNVKFMLAGFILMATFLLAFQWLYYTFTPRSFYYTYYEVHASELRVGEPLVFFSEREVKRAFPIEFLDILYCDTNGNGDFKRQFGWRSESFAPEVVDRVTPEELLQKLRDKEGFTFGDTFNPYISENAYDACYMDTKVTMHLPLGVEKTQNLRSGIFPILPAEESN